MLAIAGPLVIWRTKFWHWLRRKFSGLSGLPTQLPLNDAPELAGVVLMSPKSPFLCHILASSLRMDCCYSSLSL